MAHLPLRRDSYPLQDGDWGVERTIRWMYALVNGREGTRHPRVQATAAAATAGAPDFNSQTAALFRWVQQNIRFRTDEATSRLFGWANPEDIELIQSPVVTLGLAAGDCDDFSTLLLALLRAHGINGVFTTVARHGHDFSHVFVEAINPQTGEHLALDPTVARSFPGWRPERIMRQRRWRGLGQDPQSNPSVLQQILTSTQPLIQAAASRVAYGQRTSPLELDLGTGAGSSSSLAWLAVGLTAGVVGVTLLGGGRKRRRH